MELFVQTLVLGLLAGGVYALVAVGLALIFGVLRIATFAHGEMAMIGSYAAFFFADATGANFILAIVAGTAAGGLAGWTMSATLLRSVHRGTVDRPAEYSLIITFALSQLLIASALNGIGAEPRRTEGLWSADLHMGDWVNISGDRIVAFLGAAVMLLVLVALINGTNTGRAWRALSDSRLGAQVVGVDVVRQANLCVAVASALAGAAGALLMPMFTAFPTVGNIVLVKGFIVIVLGGLGSVRGAALGGLLLGIVEVFPSTYVSGDFRDAYGFALMILVLLLFPRGMFGARVREL